ncbi:uncharacterized protein LOC117525943 isoform X1 [Thalassophryne amazonica]|uniref:uncharacterized protein LOC117525943 isoform X1 n=1 Tax=Thalassophryne amazonica TaxID=390379 RepID=UPI00147122D1|nr:uncharacterized protein LOC117525943 isoform X1 [Thalassophryne amazonica]
MSKVQILRALLKQRLPADDDEEIFELFERTTAEYEEELGGLKEENERQRKLLDAAFNSDDKTDVQQLLVKETEVPTEQQSTSILDQEDLELHHIKKEVEELWICEKQKHQVLEVNSCMYADEDVKPRFSDFCQPQSEENREAECLANSPVEQIKIEDDKEHWGGSETFLRLGEDSCFHQHNDAVISHATASESDVSDVDCKEIKGPKSSLNSQKNEMLPVCDYRCNAGMKALSCECDQRIVRKSTLPTEEHLHPTFWLGYDRPPEKRRRVLKRTGSSVSTTTDEQDEMNQGEKLCAAAKSTRDAQTQWSDPAMDDHRYSKEPLITCERHLLPPELSHPVADSIVESDADSLLYTEIPLTEFQTLVACLQPFSPASPSMPVVDQILMTLMKLRQNFVMADLARRFKVSQGLVSKTVGMWVDIMCEHMKDFTVWLPRETIKATLPKAFKDHFANTTCVIDCTETVLQKTKNLDSYSHYYANNTVKYLVSVSPSGMIMFISDAYGGKCSDRYITQNSGFLDYLRAGDEVMGDRGFTVKDLLEEHRVNLIIPAFTLKGCQLTNGVTRTCLIAHARIHVKRAIRRLKLYKILSQTVPINLVPNIDMILKICAGLVNLRAELISRKQKTFNVMHIPTHMLIHSEICTY